MSSVTITQAQGKGLRHQLADAASALRRFANELYAAHGGWAAAGNAVTAQAKRKSRNRLMSLAEQAEAHSPALSAELRNLASRG
jgi:hypothetical protein